MDDLPPSFGPTIHNIDRSSYSHIGMGIDIDVIRGSE